MDEVDAAINNVEVLQLPNSVIVKVKFREKMFEATGPLLDAAKQALRKKLLKEFITQTRR